MMFHLKTLKYRIANPGPATRPTNPITWGPMKTRPSKASWLRRLGAKRGPAWAATATRSAGAGPVKALLTWITSLLLEQGCNLSAQLAQRRLDLRPLIPNLGVKGLVDLLFHGRVVAVAVLQLVGLRGQRLDHRARELFAFEDLVGWLDRVEVGQRTSRRRGVGGEFDRVFLGQCVDHELRRQVRIERIRPDPDAILGPLRHKAVRPVGDADDVPSERELTQRGEGIGAPEHHA